jgi:tryptophan synthase alpha chain
MNTIDARLAKIKREKRIGLMTHVVVGYPSLAATERIVKTMADAGADFIELQIPFSDPLADGPTIMKACEAAISRGTRTKDALILMNRMSRTVSIPLLFMAYYNTIYKYGTRRFCRDAKRAGAAGIIVPDMPFEEEHAEHLFQYCKENSLYIIPVISRVSTPQRLALNSARAKGFVYCTARQGTTGARKTIDPALATFLKRVRKSFNIPIAVGFGISNRAHVEAIKPYADIIVVGSALIDIINKTKPMQLQTTIKKFIRSIISH